MSNNLSYKGYKGTIDVSIEDGCLHGKILFIDDIIVYEGNTVDDIKISFEGAVNRYLAYCEKTGKSANKPYSGTFNIRVGQELHRKAVEIATHHGITLNEFICQSIKTTIEQNGSVKVEHTHHHKITIIDSTKLESFVATTEKPGVWGESYATN